MLDTINFYLVDDAYGAFSNFASYPILLDDKLWPTTEHYFQAQKFVGTEHEEQIRLELSPMKAARMGRDRKRPLRQDWDTIKDDAMRTALMAKFTQYLELRSLLLETGNATIVEHTENDSYWGDGGDGTGLNMLGIMLMGDGCAGVRLDLRFSVQKAKGDGGSLGDKKGDGGSLQPTRRVPFCLFQSEYYPRPFLCLRRTFDGPVDAL